MTVFIFAMLLIWLLKRAIVRRQLAFPAMESARTPLDAALLGVANLQTQLRFSDQSPSESTTLDASKTSDASTTGKVKLAHRQRLGRIVNRNNLFQTLAFVYCILFGLALIANIEPPNDGMWYWYSFFLNSGKRLYADMHLPLQPLYILETSAFTAVLGKGWLLSRIPAVLHLVAYCLALGLLVRQTKLSDAYKAILFTCSFFVSTAFGAIIFGDYHVLADCFVLYSLLALLSLRTSSSVRHSLELAAILGTLSGLAVSTRVNDGAALFLGVFLAIACLAPSKRLLSLLLFSLSTGFIILVILSFTGDSLHDYVQSTIFRAAAIKGNNGTVLAQPMWLLWNTAGWLFHSSSLWMFLYASEGALVLAVLFLPLRRRLGWWQVGLAVVGTYLILYIAQRMGLFADNGILVALTGLVVVLAYGLGIWVTWRFIRWLLDPERADGWDRRDILLLIPLGQLASGSMSSGGTHYSLAYEPTGVFIVLLAITPFYVRPQLPHFTAKWHYLNAEWPRLKAQWSRLANQWGRLDIHWSRDFLVGLAVLATLCAVINRSTAPFHWHTYREKPVFVDRAWYWHPDFGPMVISNDLLRMIQRVCPKVRTSGSDNELLSLPFPGGNYFCSVPPWHGYVQTFFDITSKETIQSLMDELRHSAPKWILYQRQLKTLELHEAVYNQGKPLEQRNLDQLIEQKIAEGSWQVAYTSGRDIIHQWGQLWDNEWMLIETR